MGDVTETASPICWRKANQPSAARRSETAIDDLKWSPRRKHQPRKFWRASSSASPIARPRMASASYAPKPRGLRRMDQRSYPRPAVQGDLRDLNGPVTDSLIEHALDEVRPQQFQPPTVAWGPLGIALSGIEPSMEAGSASAHTVSRISWSQAAHL